MNVLNGNRPMSTEEIAAALDLKEPTVLAVLWGLHRSEQLDAYSLTGGGLIWAPITGDLVAEAS